MTVAAWVMLGVTWAVIVFFTTKFFVQVLRTPPSPPSPSSTPRDSA